jgi:hypothetical protein
MDLFFLATHISRKLSVNFHHVQKDGVSHLIVIVMRIIVTRVVALESGDIVVVHK